MGSARGKYKTGFTLLEILLALGIMGILAIFAISIAGSVRHAAKVGETENMMDEIAAKAKATYRNTGQMAAPAGTPPDDDEVPVGSTGLNMENHYKFDAWGQPFEYYIGTTSPVITDVLVDGNEAAAVIISYGANQVPDYDDTCPGGATATQCFVTMGDDILVPIDVSQEAVEIALDELKVLQAKVYAFDALYEGIDNQGDDSPPDESGCTAAAGTDDCPPISGLSNDPNCGTATLDQIELSPGTYADCGSTGFDYANALDFINGFYSLGDAYDNDPWGNPYEWGTAATYAPSDPQYHKFFSTGPDDSIDDDDIIP